MSLPSPQGRSVANPSELLDDGGPEPGPAPFDFARLLAPGSVEEFIDQHFERHPHLVRGDPDRFDEFFDLDDVDLAVAAAPAPGTQQISSAYGFRYTNGVREDFTFNGPTGRICTAPPRAFAGGYTVIANAVRQNHRGVARLAMSIEESLQHRVDTNMYLTPPSSQGFPPHVDQHDTILVQIEGAKRWSIWKPDQELPLAGSTEFDNPPQHEPYRVVDLTPGDVLYIPHGWWHCGVTPTETHSLHLTFGVITLKWIDLLLASVRLVAENDVRFRRNLPLARGGSPTDLAHELGEVTGELFAQMGRTQACEDTVAHVTNVLLADRLDSQPPAFEQRMRSTMGRADIGRTDEVERRQGLRPVVLDTDRGCQLKFVGGFVNGPAQAKQAFEFVASADRFAALDLPGLEPGLQLQLIHELVLQGMARPVSHSG